MADLADLFRTGPNTLGGRYMRTLWHPIFIAAELKSGWIRADVGLLLYRKLWEREVMAHAEARPLKKWYRSEAVIACEDE
jgi:hypothetical protein